MAGLVAGDGELVGGELVRCDLRLLEQDDVGIVLGEQLEHARQARAERVDVPGDELHRTCFRMRRRLSDAAFVDVGRRSDAARARIDNRWLLGTGSWAGFPPGGP